MHLIWDIRFLPLLFEQIQQSTVKYRFSFRTLLDRNMKIGCHAIFFLHRVNLVPRGYIILDRTHTHPHPHTHTHTHTKLPQNIGRFSRKSGETFRLRKILFPSKLEGTAGIYKEYNGSSIIFVLKRIKGQRQGWGSRIMKVLWSPIY